MTTKADDMSEEVKLWMKYQNLLIEEIKNRVSEETGIARNHPKFERAWGIAWDEHHAYGASEVEPLFKDILELLKP